MSKPVSGRRKKKRKPSGLLDESGVPAEYKAKLINVFKEEVKGPDRYRRLHRVVYHLTQRAAKLIQRYTDPKQLFGLTEEQLLCGEESEASGFQDAKMSAYHSLLQKEDDFAKKPDSALNGLRCFKCGKGGIQISVRQTRSADEGGTGFCECPTCGARWKIS